MMNTRPQMTRVEETIRIPAWRSASPKKRNTRSLAISPTTLALNDTIEPNDSTRSRGTSSQPFPACSLSLDGSRIAVIAVPSLDDRRQFWVRGQQHLREHVVEREDPEERDHDRLIHRAPDALGAAR